MNRLLIILLGLLGICLLAFFCYKKHRPVIEEDLQTRTAEALITDGYHWSGVSAEEQTIRLTGVAPSSEARDNAEEIARNIYGVSFVDNQLTLAAAPEEPKATEPTVLSEEGQACQDRYDALLADRTIRFATSSATIANSSFALLDDLAAVAADCPAYSVDVEGHTDSDGPADSNQSLSERRAGSVMNALVERGVLAESLKSIGYGEMRPIGDNTTSAGKAQNRRIEFKVREN